MIQTRRIDADHIEQTTTNRCGAPVSYVVHTGPSRAERRDAEFRPRMVAAARERAALRQLAAENRALAARRPHVAS